MKAGAEQESEKKRAAVVKQISAKLRAFADKIAAVQVLDPACGSGNFLVRGPAPAARPAKRSHQLLGRAGRGAFLYLGFAGAAARHRDQRVRPRTGPDHHLDRLHPMAGG